MPAATLKHVRWWYAIGGVLIAVVVIASLIPVPVEIPVEEGDKLAHFAAYGSLMYWFGMLAATSAGRCGWAMALAALGVALEYAQGTTGYRSFDVMDMAANTVGVAIGWAIGLSPAGRLLDWVERRLQ